MTEHLKPLDERFNACVVNMCHLHTDGRWQAVPNALGTDTPRALEALTTQHRDTGTLYVSSEHSNRTIFGGPAYAEINHAFRAWHDAGHIVLQAGFDIKGEKHVARWQVRNMQKRYGPNPWFAALIWEEVVGQAIAREKLGHYVADQRQFAETWLKHRGHAPEAVNGCVHWETGTP